MEKLLRKIEQWNDADEYSLCIRAIELVPEAERGYQLTLLLAGLIAIWPFWAIVGRILMMVLSTRNCWLTPLLYLKKSERMGKTTLFGIPEWPMLFL